MKKSTKEKTTKFRFLKEMKENVIKIQNILKLTDARWVRLELSIFSHHRFPSLLKKALFHNPICEIILRCCHGKKTKTFSTGFKHLLNASFYFFPFHFAKSFSTPFSILSILFFSKHFYWNTFHFICLFTFCLAWCRIQCAKSTFCLEFLCATEVVLISRQKQQRAFDCHNDRSLSFRCCLYSIDFLSSVENQSRNGIYRQRSSLFVRSFCTLVCSKLSFTFQVDAFCGTNKQEKDENPFQSYKAS